MNILIADDHVLFREALTLYLTQSDPSIVVHAVPDFYQATLFHEKAKIIPELTLLDLQMPGMNGVKGFQKFRHSYPDRAVALMSGLAEIEDVKSVMKMGAVGYFPKTLSGRALLSAIQLVLSGQKFLPLSEDALDIMPSYFKSETAGHDTKKSFLGAETENLTARENDVLRLLAQGKSNKDIASNLGLQIVTVKLHLRSLCRKLKVENRTQAALKARSLIETV
jgi:two-component system, NarL family, nitrate/nitrite response regulator NarL